MSDLPTGGSFTIIPVHPNVRGSAIDMDAENAKLKPTTLAVTGMTCGSCARTVERKLRRVPGVTTAVVDLELGVAIVNGTAALSSLIAVIAAAGYGTSRERGCDRRTR